MSIVETQGNNNWCSPYCCAAIIRYLNGSSSTPKAIDLLNIVYDNPTSLDGFGVAEVYEVADYWGYSPIQYVGQLSENQIKKDLMNGKPIFVAMNVYDYDEGSYTGRHAFVLRGADFVYGAYSFWNPWYTNYVACDSSNIEIFDSANNCRFTWNDCFYDW